MTIFVITNANMLRRFMIPFNGQICYAVGRAHNKATYLILSKIGLTLKCSRGLDWASPCPKSCLLRNFFLHFYQTLTSSQKCPLSCIDLLFQVHYSNRLNTILVLKILVKTHSMGAVGCKYAMLYYDHQCQVHLCFYFLNDIRQCIE